MFWLVVSEVYDYTINGSDIPSYDDLVGRSLRKLGKGRIFLQKFGLQIYLRSSLEYTGLVIIVELIMRDYGKYCYIFLGKFRESLSFNRTRSVLYSGLYCTISHKASGPSRPVHHKLSSIFLSAYHLRP